MRVISALFNKPGRDYAVMSENFIKSLKAAGHKDIVLYPLGKDPIEEFVDRGNYKTACYFKPYTILEALNDTKEDVAWMDVDCIVKESLGEILDDCDIAVTLRRGSGLRDIYDGYINAGVMAFRNNAASRHFIREWIGQIPHSRADQDACNRVLVEGGLALAAYNETIQAGGAKVMIRSCDEYNFFYFPEANNAKVYHVKGSLRGQYYNQCAVEVLGACASLISGSV